MQSSIKISPVAKPLSICIFFMLRNYNNKYGYYCVKLFFRRFDSQPVCGYFMFPRKGDGNPYWSIGASDQQGVKTINKIHVYLEKRSKSDKNVTEGVMIFIKPAKFDFGAECPDLVLNDFTSVQELQNLFDVEACGYGDFGVPHRYILTAGVFQRSSDDTSFIHLDWSGNLKMHLGEEVCVIIFNINLYGQIIPPNANHQMHLVPSAQNTSYNGILQFNGKY